MTDGRLGGKQVDNADDTAALRRFLLDLDSNRKGADLGGSSSKDFSKMFGKENSSKFKDGFLNFDDPFASEGQQELQKLAGQARQINDLVSQRNQAEKALSPEQKDILRLARRDYSVAKTSSEQTACASKIESLVPGAAALNKQIKLGLLTMRSDLADPSRLESFSPRFTSTIQCHSSRPEPSYFEQQAAARRRNEYAIREGVRDASDRFYNPLPEDKFEARWAKMALESPVVRATEALKQLPPIKVSAENAADVVKFALTVGGVEIDSKTRKMLEDATRGVKVIAKEGSDGFLIERGMKSEYQLPEKIKIEGGMAVTGLEIGTLRFRLGDGKYPELKDIEGLKVKLEVPTLGKIVQIDNETQIKRLFMTRNEGTGDFTVNVEVTNPVPTLTRHAAHMWNNAMPTSDTIVAPIATLGPDGKMR